MTGAATVRGWAKDVKRFADTWPGQAADVLARTLEAQLRADGGGQFRDGTRATVGTDASAGEGEVTGDGAGVWAILEHGTTAHTVTGKGAHGLVRTPFGPRRTVTVGGVRPKRTWSTGVERGMADVAADADRAWAWVG